MHVCTPNPEPFQNSHQIGSKIFKKTSFHPVIRMSINTVNAPHPHLHHFGPSFKVGSVEISGAST